MSRMLQLRAARSAAPAAQTPAPAISSGGVIQAKLQILGTMLEEGKQLKPPIPQKLLPYHQSQSVYQVREDWSTDLKDPMHLIAPDKAYLLGERHDASKWDEQTKEWSWVDKMFEARRAFPGIVTQKHDPKDQPLESMHAFLLHNTLYARSLLMALAADKGAVPPAKVVDDYIWAVEQILAAKVGYTKLSKAIVADKSARNYDVEIQFLLKFDPNHLLNADIAKGLATRLKTELAVKNPGKDVLEKIADLKDVVVGGAGDLTALATDLIAVLGIAANSVKGKAIAAEAASKVALDTGASQAVSIREAAMAGNINAAKRPLLVKVGDDHVERLGALVPKSVKVRAADTLAKHTLA